MGSEGIGHSVSAIPAPLQIFYAPCWDRTNDLSNVNRTLYFTLPPF